MEYVKKNWKIILAWLGLICLAFFILHYFYQKQSETESKLKQTFELSKQQAENMNILQNELKISKQNAELLADSVKKAQANKTQPNTYITVQAPTIEQATAEVKERIEKKDPALPPAATKESDRTAVVPQPENEEYKVGVYKINTYRNWYVGVGVGVHDNEWYVPVSLQRNFAKDKAVELQIHVDPHKEKIGGGQIMYKRAMNKLFYFF